MNPSSIVTRVRALKPGSGSGVLVSIDSAVHLIVSGVPGAECAFSFEFTASLPRVPNVAGADLFSRPLGYRTCDV